MVDPDKRVNPGQPNPDATSTRYSSTESSTGMADAGNKSQTEHAKHDVKNKAQETAGEVQNAARQQAESTFNRQTGAAAQETEKVAKVFHKMADEFKNQDQTYFAQYANDLAKGTDALSRRLHEKNLQDLYGDMQRYARRQPAAVMGGAIAIGFLLSRFLKSSQRNNDQSQQRSSDSYPY